MKIITDYPYDQYVGYTVINPEKRKNLCLVHKITKQRTTISYARYLVSVKEKRILNQNEHVDHIDGDKTNDSIENLQILTAKENNNKRVKENNISLKMVEMICPNCKSLFSKELGNSFLQKKGRFNTCSKKCLYSILSKGFSLNELSEIGKSQIVRHYRK